MFPISLFALILLKTSKKNISSSSIISAIFFLFLFKFDYVLFLMSDELYFNPLLNSFFLNVLIILSLNIFIYFFNSNLLLGINKGLIYATIFNIIQSMLFNIKPINLFFPIMDSDLNFSLFDYLYKSQIDFFFIFIYYAIEFFFIVIYKDFILRSLILAKAKASVVNRFYYIGKIIKIINFSVIMGISIMYFYDGNFSRDVFILSSFCISIHLLISVYMTYTLNFSNR